MSDLRTFDQSKEIGDIGQKAFKELLIQKGNKEVSLAQFTEKLVMDEEGFFTDVSKTPEFYEPDIDVILCTAPRNYIRLEIKTDTLTFKTGNVFFETKLASHAGWGLRSKADYIIYYLPQSKVFYAINLLALREYVESKNFEEIVCKNKEDYSEGKRIPLQPLILLGIAKEYK